MKKRGGILTFCMAVILILSGGFSMLTSAAQQFPSHEPYGKGVGAMPGRVVWSYEPSSVSWDGEGFWWETEHFDEDVILNMVENSIATLGGADDAVEGWRALFVYRNGENGKSGGYEKGEKIAIKANINGSAVMDDDTSGETKMSYTNPVLLKALLMSLVKDAGVDASDITVYDVSRLFPDYMVKMCTEGILAGVNFVGRDNGIADKNAPIVWSCKFGGAVNYLPTCVTEADYVINLANLKGHSYGITLCGKNHFGSFINGNSMRPPEGANLHQWLTRGEMGIYSPLVDLMANKHLGGKTVLYMLDAIICAPSEGAYITGENALWRQTPFNGGYTSSIFVSQDPVAIDSVGADFLANEPAVTENNYAAKSPNVENYLHEAGLAANAPSGVEYTDGFGKAVENLGVHEHWNDPEKKQYSRNLGKNEGIELVTAGKKPSVREENGKIFVENAAEDAALILAFYKGDVLTRVSICRGKDAEIDVWSTEGEDSTDADGVKAFYWDTQSISPLCDMLSFSKNKPQTPKKTLVVYFSRTKNTEGVAKHIANAAGADIYEIVPKEPYGEENDNYYDPDTRAYKEQYDDTARPEISGEAADMAQYDKIYLGYPIWYGKAPKVIYTFLESYDFTGKTIVPFCTSGSSPLGSTEELQRLTPGAKWLEGKRFPGGASQDEVAEWIDGL